MYNRYIRNDDGVYQRIQVHEKFTHNAAAPPPAREDAGSAGHGSSHNEAHEREKRGLLSSLLGKLKPDEVDSGDLLLLVLLFLLFKEGEDEELLIALGLLLIL